MAKEAALAAPQRAAKASREPQRPTSAAVSGVHDSASSVEYMQQTAGNAAVTEHLAGGSLDLRSAIAASAIAESSGRPLDPAALRMMAAYFEHDLSHVRVHDDGRSAESLAPLDAAAYTVGNAVVAPPGALDVQSPSGRALLAHELTHVVQQTSASSTRAESPAGEMQAGAMARAAGANDGGASAPAIAAGTAGVGVARKPKDGAPQSFHQVALQANRYWSTRISGWPGDESLRTLWNAKKYDEFADAVRDYQRTAKDAKGIKTDGVVEQATMAALKANPIAKETRDKKNMSESAANPVTGKAPSADAAAAKPAAAAPPPPAAVQVAPAAPPPAGRHRFDGALGLLKAAKRESVAGNQEKAQHILQLIDEQFLGTFRYDDSAIRKVFPNLSGMGLTAALMLVQRSTGAVKALRSYYRIGMTPKGLWDAEITNFAAGAEPIRALCGDSTGADAKNLQTYDRYSKIAFGVAAVVIAAPLVIAAGLELGPAAIATVQGSSLYMLALQHPIAAVDLTALAVGKTIQLVNTGEITISLEDVYTILYHGTDLYFSTSGRVTSTGRGTATITIETEPVETPAPSGGASRGGKGSGAMGAPAEEHESGGTPPSGGKSGAPAVTESKAPPSAAKPAAPAKPPTPQKAPAPSAQAPEEAPAAPATKAKATAGSSAPKVKSPAAAAASKPMRARPPGSPPRGTYTSTSKTTGPAGKPSNPEVSNRASSSPSKSFAPDDATRGKIKSTEGADTAATEAHGDLPRSKQQKTMASSAGTDTKPKMSGSAHLSEQGEEAKIAEIEAHAKTIGHKLESHPRDTPGKPGSYLAVHAEKQAIVEHPNKPVAVTREMCGDCVSFFKREAKFQGQNQVVKYPAGTHVFEPSGAITEYRTDGTIVRFEVDGSVSVRPPEKSSK